MAIIVNASTFDNCFITRVMIINCTVSYQGTEDRRLYSNLCTLCTYVFRQKILYLESGAVHELLQPKKFTQVYYGMGSPTKTLQNTHQYLKYRVSCMKLGENVLLASLQKLLG